MFRGSIYCRRWTYQEKRRMTWGVRYSVNGGKPVRKIVADTREGAQTELDRLKEDYRHRLLGVAEGKTFTDLVPLFLAHKETQGRAMERVLQANPALRERVEASLRAQRMDLLQRLAQALKVMAWRR